MYRFSTRLPSPRVVVRGVSSSAGFTLLEVLIVVFILSATALAAIAVVDVTDGQFRQQDTMARLKRIEQAVLGDSSLSLNGEPILSGFVADVGRLPMSPEELAHGHGSHSGAHPLVARGDAPQPPTFDPTPDADGYDSRPGESSFGTGTHGDAIYLDAIGGTDQPDQLDSIFAISHGYRGGYLPDASLKIGGSFTEHVDGWGNPWKWRPTPALTSSTPVHEVQRLDIVGVGADGLDDADRTSGPADENEQDISASIVSNAWKTGTIQVTLNKKTTGTQKLGVCLLVYTDRGNTAASSYTTVSGATERKHGFWRRINAKTPVGPQNIGKDATATFKFDGLTQDIPFGDHYVLVYKEDSAASPPKPLLLDPTGAKRYAATYRRFLPRIDSAFTMELKD